MKQARRALGSSGPKSHGEPSAKKKRSSQSKNRKLLIKGLHKRMVRVQMRVLFEFLADLPSLAKLTRLPIQSGPAGQKPARTALFKKDIFWL